MDENGIREALDRHWAASDASDFDAEHAIYHDDALLEYPQSGERIRGRHNIQASRAAQPNTKHFTVRRIIGAGDLWVTEFILDYDGRPSFTVRRTYPPAGPDLGIPDRLGRRGSHGEAAARRAVVRDIEPMARWTCERLVLVLCNVGGWPLG